MKEEFKKPSKYFLDFLAKMNRFPHDVKQLTPIVKKACKTFIKEEIKEAVCSKETRKEMYMPWFCKVESILEGRKLEMRPNDSYCPINLDHNRNKTICRLNFFGCPGKNLRNYVENKW